MAYRTNSNYNAMRRVILSLILALCATTLSAREPLYVVNGRIVDNINDIPQEDIESIDILPATEATIAEWGTGATEGVILIRLIYDSPARYAVAPYNNFTAYLADNVKWDDRMPAERVSLRLKIDAEGNATISEVLQSTSRQFLKRVTQAIAKAPRWEAAVRDGHPVESIVLVNLLLPEGKSLPAEHAVIIR